MKNCSAARSFFLAFFGCFFCCRWWVGVGFSLVFLGLGLSGRAQSLLLDFTFEGTTTPVTDVFGGSFFSAIDNNPNSGPYFDSYMGGTNPSADVTYPCGGPPVSPGTQALYYDTWSTGDAYRFTFNTQVSNQNLKWSFCSRATHSAIGQFVARASHDDGATWYYFNGGWGNPNPPGPWTPSSSWGNSWQQFPSVFENKPNVWFEIYKTNNPMSGSYWFGIDNFRIHGDDACTHPDKAALVELYNSTDGPNWTHYFLQCLLMGRN